MNSRTLNQLLISAAFCTGCGIATAQTGTPTNPPSEAVPAPKVMTDSATMDSMPTKDECNKMMASHKSGTMSMTDTAMNKKMEQCKMVLKSKSSGTKLPSPTKSEATSPN